MVCKIFVDSPVEIDKFLKETRAKFVPTHLLRTSSCDLHVLAEMENDDQRRVYNYVMNNSQTVRVMKFLKISSNLPKSLKVCTKSLEITQRRWINGLRNP